MFISRFSEIYTYITYSYTLYYKKNMEGLRLPFTDFYLYANIFKLMILMWGNNEQKKCDLLFSFCSEIE